MKSDFDIEKWLEEQVAIDAETEGTLIYELMKKNAKKMGLDWDEMLYARDNCVSGSGCKPPTGILKRCPSEHIPYV